MALRLLVFGRRRHICWIKARSIWTHITCIGALKRPPVRATRDVRNSIHEMRPQMCGFELYWTPQNPGWLGMNWESQGGHGRAVEAPLWRQPACAPCSIELAPKAPGRGWIELAPKLHHKPPDVELNCDPKTHWIGHPCGPQALYIPEGVSGWTDRRYV